MTGKEKITKEDLEIWESHYGGSMFFICLELLNGEYTLEKFREDVLSWRETNDEDRK